MVNPIKTTVKYNDGLFSNPTYQRLVKVITELIKKSNEQTAVINDLLKEIELLKANK